MARGLLKSKLIDALKVGVLDRLRALGAITADEEAFLRTLDEATFGAFFLTPYLNLASGKTATDGLELKILETFNATRPGKWLLDPNQAAKDTRPVLQWLAACQLPTRIFEGVFSWFSSSADSACAVPNSAPTIALTISPNPVNSGSVVRLDASASTDIDRESLSFEWRLNFVRGAGNVVLVDRMQPVAYLVATQVTAGSLVDVTVTVTDSVGASTSRTERLALGGHPTCSGPQILVDGSCVTPKVPTVTLLGPSDTVVSGSRVSLAWSSTDATTCIAGGDWSGTRPTSGSASVIPASGTRRWELTCTGPGGSATTSVGAVAVIPTVAPIITIVATPSDITLGASTTLQWSVLNASSCSASGAWNGSRALSGSQTVTPTATAYGYQLTCNSATGTSTKTAELRVAGATPAPVVTITSLPTAIEVGASAMISWSATDATFCTASGAWSGTQSTSGSTTVTPTFGIHTYTLSCTGPIGTTTSNTRLTVNLPQPVPALTLTASPGSVTVGGTSTLQWSTTNAASCLASGAWTGDRSTSGTATVTPTLGTNTYTMTCTAPSGGATATASAVVAATPVLVPPAVTLSATPSGIAAGQSATLSWSATNATGCTASGGWSGTQTTTGTFTVNPAAGTSV